MKKHKNLILAGALAALAVPAVALAGYTSLHGVIISGDEAQGTVVGARNAPDRMQYISCIDGDYAYCIARDAKGTVQSCYTLDDHQRAVIRSVTSNSYIQFTSGDDGTCEHLFVRNGSQHLE